MNEGTLIVREMVAIIPKTKPSFYRCTGCDRGRDSNRLKWDSLFRAEYAHNSLKTPLCGECFYRVKNSAFNSLNQFCCWCGNGDDSRTLFICDGCSSSFCTVCVIRNFGKVECKRVKDCEPWICYICIPTAELNKLKIPPTTVCLNVSMVYDSVREKQRQSKDTENINLSYLEFISTLSQGERQLLSIFSSTISSSQINDNQIYGGFLKAQDIYGNLLCVSKAVNRFFSDYFSQFFFFPGLFKTDFGLENNLRLYPHQRESIEQMILLENPKTTIGTDDQIEDFRGGILADAPGLGKSISMLALCLSSVHRLPSTPKIEITEIQEESVAVVTLSWIELDAAGTLITLLLAALNKINRVLGRTAALLDVFENFLPLRKSKQIVYPTPESFERAVSRMVAEKCRESHNHTTHIMIMQTFRQDMALIKCKLHKKSRRFLQTKIGRRLSFELSLRSSSATLIIVPLALLEHWFEQITRHINLQYYSEDNDGRGVVYIDGLGDIVDIEIPLQKLAVMDKINISIDVLSSYVIVVTTFERCVLLHRLQQHSSLDLDNDDFDSTTQNIPIQKASSNHEVNIILGIRWQRLVVDEGHDLAASVSTEQFHDLMRHQVSAAADFICEISAEKRWCMSGTPTTGTESITAFTQLQRLLCFLRHKYFGVDGNEARKRWSDEIVKPILNNDLKAFENLVSILDGLLIRHIKEDLHLYEPIYSQEVLYPIYDRTNLREQAARPIDRAMANFIASHVSEAKKEWRNASKLRVSLPRIFTSNPIRRPKAIIFSQDSNDLQGVAHFLYLDPRCGESSICEHHGAFRSSELSRFRHSKRKFRRCPLCNHENLVTSGGYCEKTLLLVEYEIERHEHEAFDEKTEEAEVIYAAAEGGHGADGPGGHFLGHCLCRVNGCESPCHGFRNSLRDFPSNFALIPEEQIISWSPGRRWNVNEIVTIGRREKIDFQDPLPENTPDFQAAGDTFPILWKNGIKGGRARIVMWKKCGGRKSWHPDKILERVPWHVEEEDASILLLHEDGSRGLDLSFVTHIFLLERIKDPALENQIISRAHRMGATGPVHVILIQVISKTHEESKLDDLSHA